jgi:hypothetical protein
MPSESSREEVYGFGIRGLLTQAEEMLKAPTKDSDAVW